MTNTRRFLTVAAVLGMSLGYAGVAAADGLGDLLFRALPFAGNSNNYTSPQNGPFFNFNSYSQRLENNVLGGGYTFENYRFFGSDTFNNPDTLDLGTLKVQLGGDGSVLNNPQPVGIHNLVGFTTTGIPSIKFQQNTGQRIFDTFSGVSQFSPAPINYHVTVDTGVEQTQWTGNASINTTGSVNALGFYDYTLRMNNVGSYTASGALAEDEKVTDFDSGPISLHGNLFADAISNLFQQQGTTAAAVPTRIGSGASAKSGKSVSELMDDLKSGKKISDDDMQFLMQQMFTTAFTADPIGVLTNGLPSVIPGFEGFSLGTSPATPPADSSATAAAAAANGTATPTQTPEPGTLLLLASAAMIVWATRWAERRIGPRMNRIRLA